MIKFVLLLAFACLATALQIKMDPEACGAGTQPRNVSDASGTITSPNHPEAYPASQLCTWQFNSVTGQKVLLDFAPTFNVQQCGEPGQCDCDYVEVFNGPDDQSPLMGKYCGTSSPKAIASRDHQLFMRFVSNADTQTTGFSVTYTTDGSGTGEGSTEPCVRLGTGANITDASGTFTSPNYPSPYGNSLFCRWTLTAPTGLSVLANVTDFASEANLDYLEVYDGTSTAGRHFGRVSGSTNVATYISTNSQSLFFAFTTDASVVARGFNVNYRHIPYPAAKMLRDGRHH